MFTVALDRIQPNPWQTRSGYDLEYVRELAKDIASRAETRQSTKGLLQVPLARIVDADGEPVTSCESSSGTRIPFSEQTLRDIELGDLLRTHDLYAQLAFGHNRFKAFQLLAGKADTMPIELGISLNEARAWEQFPLEYADLSDEAMATAAWTENAQRKDLSPLEEARALQQALHHFGWTQTELGERWGMASSTISNKLRLLRLPEEIQEVVDAGEISERKAMALLPLYQLPDVTFQAVKEHPWYNPGKLLDSARNGRPSGWMREKVDDVIDAKTGNFEEDWALAAMEHRFEDEEIRSPTCGDCALLFDRKGKLLCGDQACHNRKRDLWRKIYVQRASEATGLPVLPGSLERGDLYSKIERFTFGVDLSMARELLEEGCDCLHVEWAGGNWQDDGLHLDDWGFPDARVVCYPPDGNPCTCIAAKKAAQTREQNANDDALQVQRDLERQAARITGEADDLLATALKDHVPAAWLMVLRCVNSNMRGHGDDWNLDKVASKLAHYTLRHTASLRWHEDDPKATQRRIEEALHDVGLPTPWDRNIDAIEEQLRRIEGWIEEIAHDGREATAEAVQGNLDNLDALEEQLHRIIGPRPRGELLQDESRLLDDIADDRILLQSWDEETGELNVMQAIDSVAKELTV
jgi:hypothetical protein